MNVVVETARPPASTDAVWQMLREVADPELPFLSVVDLGVVRQVRLDDGSVEVEITPTYSGCPAMEVIENSVRDRLVDAGFEAPRVVRQFRPAWTTDWITEEGKRLLEAHGYAPPGAAPTGDELVQLPVSCPHCKSRNTEVVSEFGSTACKALRRCRDCGEPFDHFKPI